MIIAGRTKWKANKSKTTSEGDKKDLKHIQGSLLMHQVFLVISKFTFTQYCQIAKTTISFSNTVKLLWKLIRCATAVHLFNFITHLPEIYVSQPWLTWHWSNMDCLPLQIAAQLVPSWQPLALLWTVNKMWEHNKAIRTRVRCILKVAWIIAGVVKRKAESTQPFHL